MIQRLHSPLLLAVLFVGAPSALALQDAPSENRPAYSFLRQLEDWSQFHAAEDPVDLFDPLKHIDLSADGDVWIGFGGRIESRFESWSNFGSAPQNDDDFLLSRALVHTDLHAGERFRMFVEGKSAQATDRDLPGGRRTLDMDSLDLQQAFVDVVVPLGASQLTVRPGRQMLLFGAQRLISPLPWGNTLRTWDGVTGEWRGENWKVTGIATAFAPVDKTEFNEADDDMTLFGIYAARKPCSSGHALELYALGDERENVTVNGTSGDEQRQTYGGRVWGPMCSQTDYEVEGAWQTGEVGSGDVNAWFVAAQAGWKPAGWAGSPRLWLGLDLASGDKSSGGDVETFHQLFPLGHAYFGFIDAIGRQNIVDTSLGGKWKLCQATNFSTAAHVFRLMDTSDALYNAGGGGAAPAGGFDSKEVGTELDFLADHSFDRHLQGYLGYSHLFAGDALDELGPGKDVDFAYLGAKYTF